MAALQSFCSSLFITGRHNPLSIIADIIDILIRDDRKNHETGMFFPAKLFACHTFL